MTKIKPPTNCPECKSDLIWKNSLLYCINPECSGQTSKAVEHFCKTIKIKGLGPSAINKLGLTSIDQIYKLSEEEIADRLGSEKIAAKVFSEIEKSRKAPLNLILPGLSIRLVGKSATDRLSKICNSLFDIDKNTCKKAGLGDIATQNLLEWIDQSFDLVAELPFSFEFDKHTTANKNKGVVCISGKLKSCKTKAEAKQKLESAGYVVKDTVTKEVTILLNESGIESSKTKAARNNGKVIETDITNLIGE